MGARKSKRSRSTNLDRNRYGVRAVQTRAPLPVIVVVCDDARTAVSYFTELKRLLKEQLTLTVRPKPGDRASAHEVVELARRELAGLKSKSGHSRDAGDQSSVWALIDLEHTPDQRAAAERARELGTRHGVQVARSKPCFEVWTLLHLEDTGSDFADCKAVLARVEERWAAKFGQPLGKKAQADYSKIIADRGTTASRAKLHCERDDPSWTEVYLLIEKIDEVCQPREATQAKAQVRIQRNPRRQSSRTENP